MTKFRAAVLSLVIGSLVGVAFYFGVSIVERDGWNKGFLDCKSLYYSSSVNEGDSWIQLEPVPFGAYNEESYANNK